MSMTPDRPDSLVRWRYTPAEWKAFVDFETVEYRKYIRSTLIGFIVVALIALLLIAVLLVIPLILMGTGLRADVLGPLFGVGIVAAIILGAIGVSLAVSRGRIVRLKNSSGEAEIMLNGLRVGGGWFGWGFEKTGWRFGNAKRRTIDSPLGSRFEVIEIRCNALNQGRSAVRNVPKVGRVPIPFGREAEAEMVIKRLSAERERNIANYDN
jgi:hypothetical protein